MAATSRSPAASSSISNRHATSCARSACARSRWPPTCAIRRPSTTAISTAVSELGRLDIVVNGAAGNFICLAENLSPNGFGTVVDIDLKGTFNVSRAAFPHLKAQGGSVLNISATLPYLGTIGQAHASAAKAGVDSLTRTLAVRVGTARHPRQRHRARSDRRHRRRARG